MLEIWTKIAVLFLVWGLAVLLLSRRFPRRRALDIACMGLLIYLMVESALHGEYSLRYLAG